jgi:hypothetical protein
MEKSSGAEQWVEEIGVRAAKWRGGEKWIK